MLFQHSADSLAVFLCHIFFFTICAYCTQRSLEFGRANIMLGSELLNTPSFSFYYESAMK